VGWGHSTIHDTLAFAAQAGVKHLVPFHHDPARDDDALDRVIGAAVKDVGPGFPVTAAAEGAVFELV
jgi:ribonuclease BN (tRNA processing enzyme)